MTSKIKIILIEDDKKKIEDIRDFLNTEFGYQDLVIKESYQSGLKALIDNDYNLLLLDMSIPTWDKSPIEQGGNYEKFGGYKVLKEVIRKGKPIKTILISMFDDFGESDDSITLFELNKILKDEFPLIYIGAVFYSSRETKWREDLKKALGQEIYK